MSTSKEQQLVDTVAASKMSADAFPCSVTVPAELRSPYNWGLIVATQASSWSGRFSGASFYWDDAAQEIKAAVMDPGLVGTLKDIEQYLNELFQNTTQIQDFNTQALTLIGDDSGEAASKRQRTDEVGDDDVHQQRPHQPATEPSLADTATNAQLDTPAAPQVHANRMVANPDGTFSNTITVPGDRVGLLIGNQGKTVRLLKTLSGAQINIDQVNTGAEVRSIALQGTREQVERAELEIKNVLLLSQQHVPLDQLPPGSISEPIEIPSDAVGAVIGKQGDTIRLLQMKTHAHISMEKDAEAAPDAKHRTVTLSGTPECINIAKTSINTLVSAFQASRQPNGPQFDPYLLLFGQSSGTTQTILIDNNIVGVVIGPGGANFKDIRNRTRCHIQVDKNLKNPRRELTISGPNENAVQHAVTLVTNIVRNANQQIGRNQNNNYNNNRNGPSLDQQPQQVGGYGHQRFQQQHNNNNNNNNNNQQNPHHGGHGQPNNNPNMMVPFSMYPAMMGGMNPLMNPNMMLAMQQMQNQQQQQQQQQHQQQPQQNVGQTAVQPQATGNRPEPLRPVPAEKLQTFWHYYDHYVKSYPQDQALSHAHYYIENPQK